MFDKKNSTNQFAENLHIIFEVNKELYGLNIMKTESIERMTAVTKVPDSKEYVLGIINLRGDIIPVLSLRARVGLERYKEDTLDSRIIVVNSVEYRVGVAVDRVLEIVNIATESIQPAREILFKNDSQHLAGVYESDYGIIMIMDVDGLLDIKS